MKHELINIPAELDRIAKDISDMEEAGIEQVILDFFGGAKNEGAFLSSVKEYVRSVGCVCSHEYDDNELILIIKRGNDNGESIEAEY
jgi:hypothetical protein